MTTQCESDVCNCPCHTNTEIRHIVQCCVYCEKCKKNIKLASWIDHEANCMMKPACSAKPTEPTKKSAKQVKQMI